MRRALRADLPGKLLRLAEQLEGSAFGRAAGNFDGQLLSWGALHWNAGQGTLRPLLDDIIQASERARKTVGMPFTVALHNDTLFKAFIQRNILDDRGRVTKEWERILEDLYELPEAKSAMIRHAQRYLDNAAAHAVALGFHTERGLALCWDICVQNGRIDPGDWNHYLDAVLLDEHWPEWRRLKALALAMAKGSNPKWAGDVKVRKMMIALGQGRVHGAELDMERDFGIRYWADEEQRLIATWY